MELIREVFGNPFRPVALDPSWLTDVVHSLAQSTYDERILPDGHLDPVRLAVLANALEQAGCTNQAILQHLRGPETHVRGCWAIDQVLAKE